ncbi:hypothetical protein F3Y22_tig00110546pilonHSYRG00053 [Hibiscus syriacus]|uniref:Uncharacterized protein n=1 Tax=Hibiscus syriacus TaxID=106335 RepID=A0A6A3ABQ9_HIBSY|nr:ankyrin repeat-containing protein BDA1-like [Hibiscus syriacus]KAE8701548.1 hypothetical protein F3Y22_tig00110546pilonHSYRG00053 [Hibiscus syriacus]
MDMYTPRLREAAEAGNTDALHALIKEDPYILENIDKIPFVHTPLHIAADKGDIRFAMEMMILKPSFARKLNGDGLSPMHLALRSAQSMLVLRLLKIDKDLVRVKGWEGMTPFHDVVTSGNRRNSGLLVNFLEACPECIQDVTVRDETAFHLALKEDRFEAFSILIGWLQRTRRTQGSVLSFEKKLVNWKDDEGNTLLHIAAKNKQKCVCTILFVHLRCVPKIPFDKRLMALLFSINDALQALELLLDSQLWLNVKAKDSDGLTALEILHGTGKPDHNEQSNNTSDEADKIKQLKSKVTLERIRVLADRTRHSMSVDMINTMLVIMALVITAIYQSSLSPPGSIWQDNGDDNKTAPAPAPAPSNIPSTHHLSNKNFVNTSMWIFGNKTEKAGTTIMNSQMYGLFWFLNLATFGFTDLVTVFLLSSFHIFLLLAIPLYMMVICYFCSMIILAPTYTWAYVSLSFFVLFGLFPFLLFFGLLIFSKSIRQIIAEIKERTRMRKALQMSSLGPWTLMFYSQYVLDGIFGIWLPSA